jgi:hypothetical protein
MSQQTKNKTKQNKQKNIESKEKNKRKESLFLLPFFFLKEEIRPLNEFSHK